MKKMNIFITFGAMLLSFNGFSEEGSAGINVKEVVQKELESSLNICIKKARDLHRSVLIKRSSSLEFESVGLKNGFIKNNIDYNLLTFRPIPCIDPQIVVEREESPTGEKPVQMPIYEIGVQKSSEEETQKELKISMLDQCLSTSTRLKACDLYKKIKEEELREINSIQEEERLRSEVEEASPSIRESIDKILEDVTEEQ